MTLLIGLMVFVAVALCAHLALHHFAWPRRGGSRPWLHPAPDEAHGRWGRRAQHWRMFVDQAGLPWLSRWLAPGAAAVVLLAGAAAVAMNAILFATGGGLRFAGLWMVCLAATGLVIWTLVAIRRARRLRRIEQQLPPAITVMSMAMHVGQPILSALSLAAEGAREPLAGELFRVVAATRHGVELRRALLALAQRCPSEEVRFFALILTIQSESGGNAAQVLDDLTDTLRARALQRRRTRALVAEGETSAWIMTALPVIVVALRFAADPTYYSSKFGDPIFWPATLLLSVMLLVAWAFLYRITHFKY